LAKDVIPAIGHKKAKNVRKRDLVKIIDRVKDRGAPAMANRLHSVLSKLFKFAVIRDILDTSPYAFVPLPSKKGERDRALNDDEIRVFWKGLDDSDMDSLKRLGLKLLLTTAQRRSEVIKAEWQEFDLDKRVWEIPVERVKTRKKRKNIGSHLVPISDLALSLLDEIQQFSGDSPFLFPSNKRAGQHTAPATVTRALWQLMDEDNEDRIEVEYFTVHDLRRSALTAMTSIGVSEFNAGKVLNHAEVGVTGKIYNKYNYLPEKKDALGRWGAKLQSIIDGKPAKVISLKNRA